MFDFPIQNTNAVSSNLEEQIAIVYNVSRNEWNGQNTIVYNGLNESWGMFSMANTIPINEIEKATKNNAIVKFILDNDLAKFLEKSYKHIGEYFPDKTIRHHLTTENDKATLFLIIETSLSTKEAFAQSRKMFKNWELARNPNFNNYVSISTKSV